MSASIRGLTLRRVAGVMDGVQSFGLVLLLVGLGASEAAKSLGLSIAVLGFLVKLALGHRPKWLLAPSVVALAAFFLAAALSVAAAAPGFRRPAELWTLAITVAAFPLVLDACSRASRRTLFAAAILAGGALAALWGYGAHMAGFYKRMVLPSIENAVPAGEYLAASFTLALAVLLVERRGTAAGPVAGFATGVTALGLGMTLSRGPLLGALCGALVVVVTVVRRWWVAVVLVVAVAVVASAFAMANPGARAVKDGVLGTRTAEARLDTWTKTVDLVAARPLTGHGLGNYAMLGVFYRDDVRGAEHQKNAHNLLLNAAAETGVIGCGTLLLLLVLGIRDALRSVRAARWPLDRALAAGALGGAVAILVSGFFSVSLDAEPGILFFALLGLAASGAAGASRDSDGGGS